MQGDFEEAGTIVLVMVDTYMEEEHIGVSFFYFYSFQDSVRWIVWIDIKIPISKN